VRRQNLGREGENLALSFLTNRGFRLIDRNFSTRFGEIDLIVQEGRTLVFVEVKTRWSRKYGKPEEAVTPRKIQAILATARFYNTLHKKLPEKYRIDVVAVELEKNGNLKRLRHIRNVTG
jgi:putative endonuclease